MSQQQRQSTTQSVGGNKPDQQIGRPQDSQQQYTSFLPQPSGTQQFSLPSQFQPSGVQQFSAPQYSGLPQYLGSGQQYQPSAVQSFQLPQYQPVAPVTQQLQATQIESVAGIQGVILYNQYHQQTIKGESRIEYVPYQREVVEYVTQEVVEYVPREKKVTDYYAIEYTTEYVPQVYQEKYIEYVPVEQMRERVEYQAIEKQSVIQQPTFAESNIATQYVQQQPIVSTQYQAYAPQFTNQQFSTQQFTNQFQPLTASNIPVPHSSNLPATTTTFQQSYQPQVIQQSYQPQVIQQSYQPQVIQQSFSPQVIKQSYGVTQPQFVGSPSRGVVGSSAYYGASYLGGGLPSGLSGSVFPAVQSFPPQTFPGTTTAGGYPGSVLSGVNAGFTGYQPYGANIRPGVGLQAPASGAPNSLFPSTQQIPQSNKPAQK